MLSNWTICDLKSEYILTRNEIFHQFPCVKLLDINQSLWDQSLNQSQRLKLIEFNFRLSFIQKSLRAIKTTVIWFHLTGFIETSIKAFWTTALPKSETDLNCHVGFGFFVLILFSNISSLIYLSFVNVMPSYSLINVSKSVNCHVKVLAKFYLEINQRLK